jgi:hypothetical protein
VLATNSKYQELLVALKKRDDQVVAMYPYGSKVYGTAVTGSDEDYITVLRYMPEKHEILDRDDFSFVIHNEQTFQRGLWAHECYALECFFLDPSLRLKDRPWDFSLDKRVLRESISQKASHSFVKAKKKFEVEGDFKRGKKSLFHSLRILSFGHQVATEGKIINYQAANDWWWEIWTNPSLKWIDYQTIYRPIYNGLCTKFKEVCPK